ncbi:hypothetical protein AOLI_G00248990 [Acnodon oligacanthus]
MLMQEVDGSTERTTTTTRARSDSGFVPSQEAYFPETHDFSETEAFDSSVTDVGSRAFSFQGSTYTSSFQPLTGDPKPALSTSFKQASDQSVQTAYQQVASGQPVQSSSLSSFGSQNVGFDSSAAVGTGLRVSFYPSSFKPSASTSKPVQSTYQQVASAQPVPSTYQQKASEQPVQTASHRVSSAHPVQSSYQSGLFSPSAGFGSSAVGTGQSASSLYSSQDLSYTSSYKPSVGTPRPAQSTYQQGVSYRPVWSSSPPSFVSQKVGFDSSAEGTSGSRAYSFHDSTSSFQPLTSGSKPALSTSLQQAASAQPVPSSSSRFVSPNVGLDFGGKGSSVSGAYPYASSFKPSTSTSKPVPSTYQQKASEQPVQTASHRVSSAQPVQSSYRSDLSSPSVGFDSSAAGSRGSRAYSYTTSLKPSTSASQPVQSTYQQKPVQTASQRASSAHPVLSSYRSGLYSQNVGFDSSAGTGSGVSSYTSSFRSPTSISKPVPSSYQQVTLSQPVQSSYPSGTSGIGLASSDSRAYSSSGSSYPSSRNPPTSVFNSLRSPLQQFAVAQPAQSSYPPEAASQNIRMDSSLTSISTPSQSTCRQVTAAQPVQSRNQDVPFSQTSYGASLSGVTSTGSRSVYTPSDSVASAQAFASPHSYAQAVSSLDNSQPSAGSPRLTWTQKVLE